MSDARQTFIDEIIAQPDDDHVRLVYADWLEEQEDAQAELIRVQVEQARLPWHEARWWDLYDRERQLLKKLGTKLLKQQPRPKNISWSLAPFAISTDLAFDKLLFRRGFVEVGGAKHVKALNDAEPVLREQTLLRELGLFGGKLEQLVQSPLLARLRGLYLTTARNGAVGMQHLANSAAAAGLRSLNLAENHIGDVGVALLRNSSLANLRYLNLAFNGLTDEALTMLLRWKPFSAMSGLVLGLNAFGEGLANFLASTSLKSLHLLDLSNCRLTGAHTTALASSPHLQQLTHLSLGCNNHLDDDAFRELFNAPLMTNLRILSLRKTRLGDASLERLAYATQRHRLRSLDLSGTLITRNGLQNLAAAPHLQLRRLNLGRARFANNLGDKELLICEATAQALIDSPALAQLEYFNLGGITFQGQAKAMLKKRFRQAVNDNPFAN